MGRTPCCEKGKVKRGPWSPEEDATLTNYLKKHGTAGSWIALPHKAGLKRCGKSCRLRWLNYLRPHIKRGGFTQDEDNLICTLYATIGSRWSVIAAQLAGRTDNDVKNHWNTKLKKKFLAAASSGNTNDSCSSAHISNTSSCPCPPQWSLPPPQQPKGEAAIIAFDHHQNSSSACFDSSVGAPIPVPLESDASGCCTLPRAKGVSSVPSDYSSVDSFAIKDQQDGGGNWLGYYYEHEGGREDDDAFSLDFVYDDLLNHHNGFASQDKSTQVAQSSG